MILVTTAVENSIPKTFPRVAEIQSLGFPEHLRGPL
jgi:hypothetical protein